MKAKKIISLFSCMAVMGTLFTAVPASAAESDFTDTFERETVANDTTKVTAGANVSIGNSPVIGAGKALKVEDNIKYRRLLNQLRSRKILREEFA